MNKSRRTALGKIEDTLTEIMETLDNIREDEQGAFDCIPENLQQGTKGGKMQEAISNMEQAVSEIESAIQSVSEAANQ